VSSPAGRTLIGKVDRLVLKVNPATLGAAVPLFRTRSP